MAAARPRASHACTTHTYLLRLSVGNRLAERARTLQYVGMGIGIQQ